MLDALEEGEDVDGVVGVAGAGQGDGDERRVPWPHVAPARRTSRRPRRRRRAGGRARRAARRGRGPRTGRRRRAPCRRPATLAPPRPARGAGPVAAAPRPGRGRARGCRAGTSRRVPAGTSSAASPVARGGQTVGVQVDVRGVVEVRPGRTGVGEQERRGRHDEGRPSRSCRGAATGRAAARVRRAWRGGAVGSGRGPGRRVAGRTGGWEAPEPSSPVASSPAAGPVSRGPAVGALP